MAILLFRRKLKNRTVRCPGEMWHVLHLCCLCKLRLSLVSQEFSLCGLLRVFADGICHWVCSTQLEAPLVLGRSVLLGTCFLSQQRVSASVGTVTTCGLLWSHPLCFVTLLTGAVARLIMRWIGVPGICLPLLPWKCCSVFPQPGYAIWGTIYS